MDLRNLVTVLKLPLITNNVAIVARQRYIAAISDLKCLN